MMYFKKAVLGITFFLFIASGCKKKQCYDCYEFYGFFEVSKNNDTVWNSAILRVSLQDSINHYVSLGYHVDTVSGGYTYEQANRGCDPSGSLGVYDSCVISPH